jgi:hypothetical protein
MRAWKDALS